MATLKHPRIGANPLRTASSQPISGGTAERSRFRAVLIRLGIVAASLAVGIALFALGYELFATVRYYVWRAEFDNFGNFERITIESPNPDLMWEYKPYGKRPSPPLLTTNRFGFRERDFETKQKPSGILRVAFVGDSVTLGLLVRRTDTFIRQIEVAANKRLDPPVLQALNFGIDGYNTPQIAELLRTKVFDYDPDLVIYSLCMNDFDFEDSSGMKILYFRKPRSFLIRRLEVMRRRQLGIGFYRYHYGRTKHRVFAEIAHMRDLAEQNDALFAVAILPIFSHKQATWRFDNYILADVHAEVLDNLRARNVEVIDTLPTFQTLGRPPRAVSADRWHPNREGHTVIAEALVGPVLELLH